MASWTDIPLDILALIAQHLIVIEDFATFSAICKDCRLIGAILKDKISLPPRYPRLMLAENKHVPSLRGFLNLLTSTTIEVELPEATGRFCHGAHYGWLFTLGYDLQMNLLHPFSRQQIGLPSMLTLPDQFEYGEEFTPEKVVDMFVQKIAVSESPLKHKNLNDECVIVAIYGEFSTLAFARIRDIVWTNIEVPFKGYKDVIYYKGRFYAVCWDGVVVVCDIDDNNGPKAMVVVPAPCESCDETRKYLVESSGDLLLVFREPMLEDENGEEKEDFDDWENEDDGHDNDMVDEEDFVNWENEDDGHHNNMVDEAKNVNNGSDKEEKKPHYYTIAFSIWRLDESCEEGNNCDYKYKWTEVTTLKDRALFLGRNVSTSRASCDGIKGNCIYFTDDYDEFFDHEPDGGGWDTGFVNIEDGIIHFDYTQESLSKISPSLWYA